MIMHICICVCTVICRIFGYAYAGIYEWIYNIRYLWEYVCVYGVGVLIVFKVCPVDLSVYVTISHLSLLIDNSPQ